jgi:antitoxin (DNA-binding transcriptional repressor) of toxin-antitoxin stability system
MVLKHIDLDTTAITLEELLQELSMETEILLTRGDVPVAKIAPPPSETTPLKRVLGLHEGEGWISDDFTAPLPESFWLGEHE